MLRLVRLIAFLLTVIVMTATAAEVRASTAIVASLAVDDAPELDLPNLPEPVAATRPDHRQPILIKAPRAPAPGRMHAVMIFRPPRLLASR
jgi:hypothetical protein